MFNQIALGVSVIALVCSAIAAWLTISIHRAISSLTAGADVPRLDRMITNLLSHLETSKKKQHELLELIETLRQKELMHIQHVGLVRFNPFSDIGGDQSFSLALLDGLRNGFVISSLHLRDETRLFVKPVRSGKSDGHELSTEEQQAIHEAQER